MKIGEALNVQHVDFVDEEHAWHELGHSLIDVLVDDFVDLFSQLVGDFSLLGLDELTHHRHDVVATLRTSVGNVQVVQGDVLDHLLLLVHFSLWQRNVLLGLEIILGGK